MQGYKMNEDDQEIINKINNEIIDVIESYRDKLEPYEIGHALIHNAVSMLLYCAPNELLGIKTVLKSVEIGIKSYEENHS